jgi:hypothetical protein
MRATVSNDYGFAGMNHEDMKASYKRLVKIHHPDLNPNDRESATERTKILNAEFAYYFARAATEYVRNEKVNNADTEEKKEYYRNRYNDVFVESLEAMINEIYSRNIDQIQNVSVDLVGVFIWIAGISWDMKDTQAQVKSLGFQGSYKHHDDGAKEYMWKWTPEIKRFGSNSNIDDIKRKYGTENKNRRGSYGLVKR